jgi:hypothetical protein
MVTRVGYTFGYYVSDDISIDAHIGGIIPQFGLATKYYPVKDNKSYYLLFGPTAFFPSSHHTLEDSLGNNYRTSFSSLGVNLGAGKELNLSRIWKMPLEIGATPLVYQKQKRIYLNEKGQIINEEIEYKKVPNILPLIGLGFTWYSREKI